MGARNFPYIVIVVACAALTAPASDFPITATGVPLRESFDDFDGTFASLPAGFALSKDGDGLLGEADTNDFRGTHPGGVIAGACYAWELGAENRALGYQPTEDEFTPGFFILTVSNVSGSEISAITVSYDVVCLNNGSSNRSSRLGLEISWDGMTFIGMEDMAFVSPGPSDDPQEWRSYPRLRRFALPGRMRHGGRLWLRWRSDDHGGMGTRDEIGIDNFAIVAHRPKGMVISVK